MPVVRLRHVKKVRAKGRTYWYHTVTRERLPVDLDQRIARVVEINASLGPRRIAGPGSVAAIVTAYKASPGYRDLAAKTRHDYAAYLDIIAKTIGTAAVAELRRKHVLALRDKHLDTPSKANMLVTVLRIVLAFAVEREEITTNPARDIKKLKTGDGHAAWPDSAVEAFLNTAAPMMALALKIGLYTGQREGDCLKMAWSAYDGAEIAVAQSKTGTKLSIPVHTALRAALDAEERVSPIILTTDTARPFTGSNFRHHFSKAMDAAGLTGLTFHGLRYTATKHLFEAGCTPQQVAAITGHRSLAMLEKYGRDAEQRHMAKAAMVKLEAYTGRTINGKPR